MSREGPGASTHGRLGWAPAAPKSQPDPSPAPWRPPQAPGRSARACGGWGCRQTCRQGGWGRAGGERWVSRQLDMQQSRWCDAHDGTAWATGRQAAQQLRRALRWRAHRVSMERSKVEGRTMRSPAQPVRTTEQACLKPPTAGGGWRKGGRREGRGQGGGRRWEGGGRAGVSKTPAAGPGTKRARVYWTVRGCTGQSAGCSPPGTRVTGSCSFTSAQLLGTRRRKCCAKARLPTWMGCRARGRSE